MPEPLDQRAKQHAALNIVSNLGAVLISALIGLWLTAYLIRELGVGVYSVVPLAISVGAYVSVLTRLISSSSARYIAVHFNRGDIGRSNVYFNSAFFALVYLSLGLVIPVVLVSYVGVEYLDIPEGFQGDASRLLLLMLLSLLVTAVASPLAVSSFVTHSFYLRKAADILGRVVQVGLIVLLFHLLGTQLAWVGAGYLGMSIFALLAYWVLARRLTPELRLNPRQFQWGPAREVGGTGSWLVIDQIGTLMYLNTDLLIINLVLGPEPCGQYAPILQWVMLLRVLTPALGQIFAPVAIEQIARGMLSQLGATLGQAIRLMGVALAIPVGVICGLATPVMQVWLGDEFAPLGALLAFMIFAQIFFLPLNPIYNVNRGLNKVQFPALATVIGGALNVVLSYVLARYTSLGIWGVGIATVICYGLRTTLAVSIYTARQLGLSPAVLLARTLPGIGLAAAVALAGHLLTQWLVLDDYLTLGVAGLALAGLAALLGFAFFLHADDRRLVLEASRLAEPGADDSGASEG